MAGSALIPEGARMRIIIRMAGGAVHRCAFEDIVYMTACAGSCGMLAIKVEGELRVIHGGGLPSIGGVTCRAVGSKLTCMSIILGVAGCTVHRSALELAVLMAVLAGDGGMFAIKMEGKLRVIYCCRLPAIGGVTCRALCAELSIVRVILGVTGGAVHGRAFENAIDMALLTGNRGMFPVQMEREFRVIHRRRFPSIGQVTCGAIPPKLTVVMIILFMAGETILRSGFQVSKVVRVDMTGGTFRKDMFSVEIKFHFVMVKVRAA